MQFRPLFLRLAALPLLALPLAAQVFVGSDDFSSLSIPNNNWDYQQRITGYTGNGLLAVTASRLDFTKGAGNGSSLIGWNNDHDTGTAGSVVPSSYTTSWQMDLTVNNTLASTTGISSVIGFEATDSTGNYYEFVLSSTDSGNWFHVENTGSNLTNPVATDTTDVFLRMTWDAGTQALSSYYSYDGSSYSLANTFNPVGTWNANLSNGFWFEVFALSNDPGAISAGSMYADDFSLTAVPEPSTYAALAGLAAFALVLRRRFARPAAGNI